VDADADRERQTQVSEYLRPGTAVVVAAGFSPCRLCGRPNCSAEPTDGTHIWPEGLVHYVDQHSVRLSEEVTAATSGRPA
jgi:hypothetical protein